MNLNRKKSNTYGLSGNVLRIKKISNDQIFYTIFENSFLAEQGLNGIDKNIENTCVHSYKGKSCEADELTLLQLIQAVEPDFIIENDERNWYIETGTTGLTTLFRVLIPNKAYDEALQSKDNSEGYYYPLWQVISFATGNINADFSQITEHTLVQYLEELLPEHRTILEMYVNDGVIIEER